MQIQKGGEKLNQLNTIFTGGTDLEAYRQISQGRQAQKVAQIREKAKLELVAEVDDKKLALLHGYMENTLAGIGEVNKPRYSYNMGNIFNFSKNDYAMENSIIHQNSDNKKAKGIKNDYKTLFMQIKTESQYARTLVEKYGTGKHEIKDKKGNITGILTIEEEGKNNYTLTFENANGSKKSITFNKGNQEDILIESQDGSGKSSFMERIGTDCSYGINKTIEFYSIGEGALPVKEQKGPGDDDYSLERVMKDGSTETNSLLYNDEQGKPVFETSREAPDYDNKIAGKAIEDILSKKGNQSISKHDLEEIFYAIEKEKGYIERKDYYTIEDFSMANWNKIDDRLKSDYKNEVEKTSSTVSGKVPETGITFIDKIYLAASMVVTSGSADENDKAIVVKHISEIDMPVLKEMKALGVRIVACRGSVTDHWTHLKGVKPRGWPQGSTWDKVPGGCSGKEVVIAVIGHGTSKGPHVPDKGDGETGSDHIGAHEAGHALDYAKGEESKNPAFLAAREMDMGALSDYEKQPPPAGAEETFAESLALFINSPFTMWFKRPNLFKYFKQRSP